MKVDVLFTLNEPIDSDHPCTVVVVDVLRATSSMTMALASGCKEVVAFSSIEESIEFASELGSCDYVLAGERRGDKPEGFVLGNSPQEFTKQVVDGKKVVFTTTNGTVAINRCKGQKRVMTGCFLNASAVLKRCIELGEDVVVMCSGQDGRFAMEDILFAGFLSSELSDLGACLTDAAQVASMLYRLNSKDIRGALRATDHGRYLCELGYEEDVDFCAQISRFDVVPFVCGNVVRC